MARACSKDDSEEAREGGPGKEEGLEAHEGAVLLAPFRSASYAPVGSEAVLHRADRGSGTPWPTGRLRYEVSMAVKRLWDDYMERCLAALGPEATPADVIEKIAKGEGPGGDPVNGPSFVFHADPSGDCWVNAKEGRVPVPLLKALELAGHRVVVLPDPPEGEYPAIGFAARGAAPAAERGGA